MISLSQTRYGSGRWPGGARHGRSRRWRSYQASSSAGSGAPCGGGDWDRSDDMSAAKRRRSLAGPEAEGERRHGFRAVGLAVSKLAAPIVGQARRRDSRAAQGGLGGDRRRRMERCRMAGGTRPRRRAEAAHRTRRGARAAAPLAAADRTRQPLFRPPCGDAPGSRARELAAGAAARPAAAASARRGRGARARPATFRESRSPNCARRSTVSAGP